MSGVIIEDTSVRMLRFTPISSVIKHLIILVIMQREPLKTLFIAVKCDVARSSKAGFRSFYEDFFMKIDAVGVLTMMVSDISEITAG